LDHAVRLADATVFIVDHDLVEILTASLRRAGIDSAVIVNAVPAVESAAPGHRRPVLADLYSGSRAEPVDVSFSDVSALLYTSGTTGRSKACT
ncbi:AMP-binding protein, partial [Mycobacterium kansasii]